MLKSKFFSLTLLFVGMFSTLAMAHKQKEAYTQLLFNQRTGNLEISHRFYVHDIGHAAGKLFQRKVEIISNKTDQQAFADYLKKKFLIKDAQDNLLDLPILGYEIEGKFLWIYQEIPLSENMQVLSVRMQALQEVFADQINHVNLERKAKKVQSLRFLKEDDWKVFNLKE